MTFGETTGGARVMDSAANPQIEYHEPTESYRTEFDQQTRPLTNAVVTAVATAAGRDPLDLQPLWSAVDLDALTAFFASASNEATHSESAVTFEYADHLVTVNGHGTVTVK